MQAIEPHRWGSQVSSGSALSAIQFHSAVVNFIHVVTSIRAIEPNSQRLRAVLYCVEQLANCHRSCLCLVLCMIHCLNHFCFSLRFCFSLNHALILSSQFRTINRGNGNFRKKVEKRSPVFQGLLTPDAFALVRRRQNRHCNRRVNLVANLIRQRQQATKALVDSCCLRFYRIQLRQ